MTPPYSPEDEGESGFEQAVSAEHFDPPAPTTRDEKIVNQLVTVFGRFKQPPPPSIIDKMSPELLKLLLEQDAEESKRRDSHRDKHLYVTAGLTLAGIVAFFGLCWMFLTFNQAELLKQVITLLVGLVSGGIGGFAYGRSGKGDDD